MSTRERITAERKLYELRCVVEDLSSLTQSDDGLRALRENMSELQAAERRLRFLQLDIEVQLSVELVA